MLDIPERGTVVGGEVLRITDTAVFIDVGGKRDALFPAYELELLENETVSRGDELPIYIKGYTDGGQLLDGSLEKGLASRDWLEAKSYLEANKTAEVIIIGYNKGGLIASFGRLEGFIPNSHIPNLGYGSKRQSQKASMEGERVSAKVVEVVQERRRLILSITDAQKEERQAKLRTLAKGDVVHGRVVNLAKFGAFVDLGQDLTGLIHVSQLAHHYVDDPSHEVSVGDEVEVKIHKINYEKERIGLSRKALLPSPWTEFDDAHERGDLIEVTIRNTTDFGAFAQINETITGLIHISEYPSWTTDSHAFREGDIVLAAIKSIDPDRERVGLSLKQVTYEQEMAWLQKHRQGKEDDVVANTAVLEETEETEEPEEAVVA
ncbi:MAG: 30S ribosomal protein S1 [Anaerolineales bacterium]|nr:30S ribosomal protein S1 [Anaerolineales bacterium]